MNHDGLFATLQTQTRDMREVDCYYHKPDSLYFPLPAHDNQDNDICLINTEKEDTACKMGISTLFEGEEALLNSKRWGSLNVVVRENSYF